MKKDLKIAIINVENLEMSFLSVEMEQGTSKARKQSQILKILRVINWGKIEKILCP